MDASDINLILSSNSEDLSKKFIKICNNNTYRSRSINEASFMKCMYLLLESNYEGVLLNTLTGVKRLLIDEEWRNKLMGDQKVLSCLKALRKRCYENEQIISLVVSVLRLLYPSEVPSKLEVSYNNFEDSRLNFSRTKSRKTNQNIVKYMVKIPGSSNHVIRKEIETLFFRIRGLKSFSFHPVDESVEIFTKSDFRLALLAKIISSYAEISPIYLINRESHKMDRLIPIDFNQSEDDFSGFLTEESFCVKNRILVNPNTHKRSGWISSLSHLVSKALYW